VQNRKPMKSNTNPIKNVLSPMR